MPFIVSWKDKNEILFLFVVFFIFFIIFKMKGNKGYQNQLQMICTVISFSSSGFT